MPLDSCESPVQHIINVEIETQWQRQSNAGQTRDGYLALQRRVAGAFLSYHPAPVPTHTVASLRGLPGLEVASNETLTEILNRFVLLTCLRCNDKADPATYTAYDARSIVWLNHSLNPLI